MDIQISVETPRQARTPGDQDAARFAAVLSAHMRAEQLTTVRQLLWRRLALLGLLWLVLGAVSVIPRPGVILGIGVLIAVALWVRIAEWTAGKKLPAVAHF